MFTEWLTMWLDAIGGKKTTAVAPATQGKAKRNYKVPTGLEESWGNLMMNETTNTAQPSAAQPAPKTAVPPPEVITGVPKGISGDQPAPKQDKRRGTFWKKDPL
jgi:hypothetical protein